MQPPKPDEEDEAQIVVEAAPPPPKRKPRAQNPAVDDVIQSGEIVVPRSHVIRSQSQPAMPAVRDDPTEPTRFQSQVVAAPRKTSFIWLFAAIAPAVAAIALGFVHPAKRDVVRTAEAESVAQLIGTTLDGDAHAAQVRAEAIASSSMLRAAILTDAQTLADMARDSDITFPHGPGESIVVIQVSKEGRKTMLKIPTDAAELTPPPVGTARIERGPQGVYVVVDAPVTDKTGNAAGEIALKSPIDLTRIQKRAYEHLTGVALTGFGAPISLGGGVALANGAPITAQITTTVSAPALAVTAMVAVPPADSGDSLVKGLRYGCAGLATLLLLIFGVSLLVRR